MPGVVIHAVRALLRTSCAVQASGDADAEELATSAGLTASGVLARMLSCPWLSAHALRAGAAPLLVECCQVGGGELPGCAQSMFACLPAACCSAGT